MGKYISQVGGAGWAVGPTAECRTMREARDFAESYGATADWCVIRTRNGRVVGQYVRHGVDRFGGAVWRRATNNA